MLINHRNQMIANPNPAMAGLFGIFVYLAILFLSPTKITQEIEARSLGFVALSYLMFFFGTSFATHVKVTRVRALFVAPDRRKQRFYLATAAILSILMMVYDRIALRGVSFSGDFLERRDALAETGSSVFGIFGALLLPAVYLYLFETYRVRNAGEERLRSQVLFAMLLCLAHPAIGLILGSRSTLFSSLFFLAAFSLYFDRKEIKWRTGFKLFIAAFLFITFSGYLFVQRLDVMNMMAAYSAEYSVYAFTIQPNETAMRFLQDDKGSFRFLLMFSFVNAAQYYTHGLLELLYQVSHESEITSSNGAFLLFIPYKLLAKFVALPDVFDKIHSAKMSIGAYTSFFGPVHSDFGWFSPIFMFFFGYYSGRVFRISRVVSDYVPLSILLATTAFFFPVMNFLLFGINFYILTGFIAFAVWNRWIYAKP